jgi:hypothetical protein
MTARAGLLVDSGPARPCAWGTGPFDWGAVRAWNTLFFAAGVADNAVRLVRCSRRHRRPSGVESLPGRKDPEGAGFRSNAGGSGRDEQERGRSRTSVAPPAGRI